MIHTITWSDMLKFFIEKEDSKIEVDIGRYSYDITCDKLKRKKQLSILIFLDDKGPDHIVLGFQDFKRHLRKTNRLKRFMEVAEIQIMKYNLRSF